VPQNMEKYFGFRVTVSDFLEPEDYELIQRKIDIILKRDPALEKQFRVYMHQLVLERVRSEQFGIVGGLESRIERINLRFTINPKQRLTGDIKFMNYLYDKELHEEVDHHYRPNDILYSIRPKHFEDHGYFQNTLVTLVRVGMREQHKKIKIKVTVDPSQQYLERLKREEQADAETNLDLDFRKARVFNRQTRIFTTTQESEVASSESNEQKARTVINVKNVGTLVTDPQAPVLSQPTFNENSVLVTQVVRDLRLLKKDLVENPPAGVKNDELAIVDEVISEAPRDAKSLRKLATAGKWLATRAEKVGLTLLTDYLRQQAGL
jgi:hypothetical protein